MIDYNKFRGTTLSQDEYEKLSPKDIERVEKMDREINYDGDTWSLDVNENRKVYRKKEPPRDEGSVMRFDGEWEQTPEGYRLKKKNIRYEKR